jgi:hypothetical protein
MSRILEGVFVIGCAVVGFGMGAPEGSGIQNSLKTSVQLIALVPNNVASNVAKFSASIIGAMRHE